MMALWTMDMMAIHWNVNIVMCVEDCDEKYVRRLRADREASIQLGRTGRQDHGAPQDVAEHLMLGGMASQMDQVPEA